MTQEYAPKKEYPSGVTNLLVCIPFLPFLLMWAEDENHAPPGRDSGLWDTRRSACAETADAADVMPRSQPRPSTQIAIDCQTDSHPHARPPPRAPMRAAAAATRAAAPPSFSFGLNFFEPENGEESAFGDFAGLFGYGAAEPAPAPKPKRRTNSLPPIRRGLNKRTADAGGGDDAGDDTGGFLGGLINTAGGSGGGFLDTLVSGDFVSSASSWVC